MKSTASSYIFPNVNSRIEPEIYIRATLDGYTTTTVDVSVTGNIPGYTMEMATRGPLVSVSGLTLTDGENVVYDGDTVEDTYLTLQGNVNDMVSDRIQDASISPLTTAITIDHLEAIINGNVYAIGLENDGSFSYNAPLNPGENIIQLRVWDSNNNAGVSSILRVTVDLESLDIRVVLSWDALTDVDLHIFKRTASEGNVANSVYAWDSDRHCYYSQKTPSDFGVNEGENPFLDIDDTEGFGPETIVLEKATSGDYHIWVHLFSAEGLDSNALVRIMLNSGTLNFRQYEYELDLPAVDDYDVWYVATVRVNSNGSMSIVSVTPPEYEGDLHPQTLSTK